MSQEKALTTSNTFAEIQSMADVFYESGVFKDIKSVAQAIIKIQAGKELGLQPIYSLQRLYMVEGKLGMSAETMGSLIKSSGKYDYRVVEHSDIKCSIMFYENGKENYQSTFTIDDAKKAQLVRVGSAWLKYPRAMLFSRALSQGARIVAPDVLCGAYTVEELQNINGEYNLIDVKDSETASLPIAESINESPPEAIENSNNPYIGYLSKCPVHDVDWRPNTFGRLSHKTDDGEWCNLYKIAYIKDICIDFHAKIDTEQNFNAWLKDNYDGKTWSKLSDEEIVDACWKLDKLVKPYYEEEDTLSLDNEYYPSL